MEQEDVVNHPSHYTSGKIEVIEFIEDQNLDYHLGNTIKYICRAGKKNPNTEIEDLQKAKWYLERKISNLKGDLLLEALSNEDTEQQREVN